MNPTQTLDRLTANAFDFEPSTRVRFGPGALDDLGELARWLGGRRALLVTDSGLMAAGHGGRARDILREAGVTPFLFQEVEENPTTEHVARCLAFAREAGGIDLIVALGGGSSMDCAKGVNFLLTNGGQMEDYWGKDLAAKPMLPSIGVPTTAGTGSEAQRFALISHAETHRKMACGDIKARFRAVILDPCLLTSAPRAVAAATGMDAIVHAVESYVSTARNPMAQMFAREAWRLLEANFETVLNDRLEVDGWGRMLLGAHFAGQAIENAMLGAAHACANPLTARYGVVHGEAVGLMAPHVIRFNAGAVGSLYRDFVHAAGLDESGMGDPADLLASRVDALRAAANLPGRLSEYGVAPDRIADLAREAEPQWTGKHNPRPLSLADFEALYSAAL